MIIRFSSIGDIVLTTPVVRQLKLQQENAEIHYLTKQKFKCLLEANPYIDKLYLWEKSQKKLINSLKEEQYDFVIDLHHNLRSLYIKSLLRGTKNYSFKKLNIKKWMLVNLKINKLPDLHIVDRYLETISFFGIKDDQRGLDFFIPEQEQFDASCLPDHFRDGYIAIVLGGTYFTKKLPAEKYVQLVKNLKYNFVLLGGKAEMEAAQRIKSEAGDHVADLCGKLKIHQSASVVRQARLVITNDTGLMHIAAAFHKKILSIWGNTTPQLGMYPYYPGEGSEMLEIKNLKCRPCSKLGKHKCPQKHFNCMNMISETVIADWVKNNYDLP